MLLFLSIRYSDRHSYMHFAETQHTYAMELETQRVWDYVGDKYVCIDVFILYVYMYYAYICQCLRIFACIQNQVLHVGVACGFADILLVINLLIFQ